MSKTLLKPKELAAIYQVSTETVREWAKLGIIPCIRQTSRTLRFDEGEVRRVKAISTTGQDAANVE